MAKQIISEEFRRMQKLAGIIKEEEQPQDFSKENLRSIFDKYWGEEVLPKYGQIEASDPKLYAGLTSLLNDKSVQEEIFDEFYEMAEEEEEEYGEGMERFLYFLDKDEGLIHSHIILFSRELLANNFQNLGFTYNPDNNEWTIPEPWNSKILELRGTDDDWSAEYIYDWFLEENGKGLWPPAKNWDKERSELSSMFMEEIPIP